MNLILILTTLLHLVLVGMAQISSLVDRDDIRLVMEKISGDVVHIRPARGTLEDETVSSTANAEAPRLRSHRKNSKLEHSQQLEGHKSRKLTVSENASVAPHQDQPKNKRGKNKIDKQPRQGTKQQNGFGQHHGGKKTGGKSKTSDNIGSTCRYAKSAWSNCDDKSHMRTRVLSLKKGEPNCLPTRTILKKCKKGCRYEKGTWSQCSAGQMTREDKLQAESAGASDQNCDPIRTVNKKCKANGNAGGVKTHGQNRGTKERKHKERGERRISGQDE
ncbi:uncharacterized protein LOC108099160 [Drosophila ficusphila]|uniref:uncharacterized protein LOC108099160 n=1 Tax=Drosophila ficusphila TaxID=30025 RepID=UPI0007E643ED|nr:uncharacterized protein LOC108099160 [Drosophila ficusphila]